MISDGSFEHGFNNWQVLGTGLLENVFDQTSVDGNHYTKLSERTSDWNGIGHKIEITEEVLNSDLIVSYWTKNAHKTEGTSVRATFRVTQFGETFYVGCSSACLVANGEWMHVSDRCNIMESLGTNTDIALVEEILFYIAGPDPSFDIYLDNVSLEIWTRDRSWTAAADMRIKEFRTMDVKFNLNLPDAHHLEVKMMKNFFPFGAMIDEMMPREMDNYLEYFEVLICHLNKKVTEMVKNCGLLQNWVENF